MKYFNYLAFGYFLRIEVYMLPGEKFISDFSQIRGLLQVQLKFMHILPGLVSQLIHDGQRWRLEPQAKFNRISQDESPRNRGDPVGLVPVDEGCIGLGCSKASFGIK